jgi:hypothetical protein
MMGMRRRTVVLLAAMSVVVTAVTANLAVVKAASADSGTFSVLTYNVAGLPELISSALTPRGPSTTEIGKRIKPYDIVNVQEDFNYHKALYEANSHLHRTPTSGGAGFGSGLNTLSNYPHTGFDRQRWNSCEDNSGDCLTPKGFTFLRVTVTDGVNVDLYNLHTDAGDSPGDVTARADNLKQLTEYIKSHSSGNAVVVMGDTNSRYTRTGDIISEFAADNGLTDAWIQLERNGNAPTAGSPALLCQGTPSNSCEVVDKVLYRGGDGISLRATAYNNEHAKFLNSSGEMLSDHDAITATFSWTRNSRQGQSPPQSAPTRSLRD